MTINPYQANSSSDGDHQTNRKLNGSNLAVGLAVCLLPAINEASIFWGPVEWLFWDFRHMLPLGIKLWVVGMAANLVLFGIFIVAKQEVWISWTLFVVVASPPVVAFFALRIIGHTARDYDMHAWIALISLQVAGLSTLRSSYKGKVLVGVACISGLGLYLFHMMIYSLVT